jgi:hypothetical protein
MITPQHALDAIRRELAERVLPAVVDDRARSSAIAAIGILGDLALQVRDDDAWVQESLALLEPAVVRWRGGVPPEHLPDPLDLPPVAGETPAQRRERLLDAVEQLLTRLWREAPASQTLRDIRAVLRADLDLQLKRTHRRQSHPHRGEHSAQLHGR